MKKTLKIDGEFKKATPVLNKIKDAGFDAYFVGGSVRDRLLGLDVNDVDIATSAQPEEIKEIFDRTVDVGIEHGTVLVLTEDNKYEITTFRTESTYKDFRRPDSVTFVRSLKEDLKRRDFTMNAIALDLEGNLIDPYNGLIDLEQGIIRAVGNPHERFQEDALRMMRAVRFAAQLNFDIELETQKSIKENAQLLEKIAVERIQIEFEKLLLGKWRPKGLQAMLQTRLYEYCPELASKKAALVSLIANDKTFKNPESAWTFLIYKIDYYFPGATFNPREFLKAWKLSNRLINDARVLFYGLKKRIENPKLDALELFHLGEKFALKVEDLLDHLGEVSRHDEVRALYAKLPITDKKELAVTGHDLMKISKRRPDRWLGEAIEEALEAVVYNKVANEREEIIHWLQVEKKIPLAPNDN